MENDLRIGAKIRFVPVICKRDKITEYRYGACVRMANQSQLAGVLALLPPDQDFGPVERRSRARIS
jgi:hypothetical protein